METKDSGEYFSSQITIEANCLCLLLCLGRDDNEECQFCPFLLKRRVLFPLSHSGEFLS